MRWVLLLTSLLILTNESFAGPSKRHIKGQYGTEGMLQQVAVAPTPTATATPMPQYVNYWADGVSVGNLDNAATWQEISGITNPTLPANEGYTWMQSDGSVDFIFAANNTDASNEGEWALTGVNGVDFEDLSSARINDVSYVYLADIGNNGNAADSRGAGIDAIIYRIVEPTITGSGGSVDAGDIEAIAVAYPVVGAPTLRDAETLIVDPLTGDMYIITKREAVPSVFKLAHQSSYTGTQTLEALGQMFDIPDVSSPSASGNAVGGNASPNADGILVKSYNVMYYFPWDSASETVFEALQATPITVDGYVGGGNTTYAKSHPSQEPQGEAVTFDYSGINYFTASEYLTAHGSSATTFPFFQYARLTSVPTTITFQRGVSPTGAYASEDTYIWDTNPNTNYGTEASFVLDNPFDADSRVGLLYFPVTDIPASSTIVGVKLYTTIANEGQGWYAYRIIDSEWTEATVTWNNMPNGPPALDGVFAVSTPEIQNGINLDTITGVTIQNNMSMATIQCWVNSSCNNHGWIMPGIHATDGVQFDSQRAVTEAVRPQLVVRYID